MPLWKRYSLSVSEAAKYFGIGEGRIYQIIAEHPGADFILEIGSHVKIKRVLFERYLDSATCV
ncbi:MAG: helix-turn-helix domain-containing protein [Lachnospiraceae bacterium]|nr:helix-turn-helix domain-containing protein [Lachnospiraceae bacterium]